MARLCIVVAVLVCLSVVTQARRLVGGRETCDVDSPSVRNAVSFALYQFNKESNDMFQSRVVKVNKAEKQLVSGIKYFLNVDIGRTECKKPMTDVNACQLHSDPSMAKISTCEIEVYNRPWLSKSELLKFECP